MQLAELNLYFFLPIYTDSLQLDLQLKLDNKGEI